MTGRKRDFIYAFIVGGLLSIAAQLIFTLLQGFVPPATATVLMLACCATIGMVLAWAGVYGEMERIAGFGAILPFSGLAAGIVHAVSASVQEGNSLPRVIWDGLKGPVFVFGTGIVFTFLFVVLLRLL